MTQTINTIKCWKCSHAVSADHAGGLCPHCNATLSATNYDATAAPLLRRRTTANIKLTMLKIKASNARRSNARWGIFKNIPFLPSHRRYERLLNQVNEQKRALKKAERALHEHAVARWMSSPWRDRRDLSPKTVNGAELSQLDIGYTAAGTFTLSRKKAYRNNTKSIGDYLQQSKVS